MNIQTKTDAAKMVIGAMAFMVIGALVIWRIFLLDPFLGLVAGVYAAVYLYDNTKA